MSLPTFEPIGHAVRHSLQEAAGMMRNTETKKVELRPHRYLRECDVLKEMRMIKDKLDEYEKCQGPYVAIAAHNSKEVAALRALSEAMTAEGKLIEELKARIAVLEMALKSAAPVINCLDVYGRYLPVRYLIADALAATEPRP